MEEKLSDIESQSFKKKYIQKIFENLEYAIDQAAEERDEELVKDPQLRKALGIVEDFLRKSKRVCYGGMAINAHLPSALKFYDFSKTLPDYDFFTPTPEKDIKELLQMLHDSGFSNAVARLGMHEGTTKIFVNYTGVADITFLPPWMFSVLQDRAIADDGILFADVSFLRMNMYLELSRPRGEVERWEKVYKRLLLLNSVKQPFAEKKGRAMTRLKKDFHEATLNYLVDAKLIYAGSELKRIYSHPKTGSAQYLLNSTSPVIAYCENPEYHLPILKQIAREHNPDTILQTAHWKARGELFPEMYGILSKGRILVLLIREQFCHAYNTVNIDKTRQLRIASLDTAITLFYMLSYLKGMDGLVPKSAHDFANELVQTAMNTRDKGVPSHFSYFPTTCHGHQPSKATLLQAKAERVAAMKKTRRNRSGKIPRGKTQKR